RLNKTGLAAAPANGHEHVANVAKRDRFARTQVGRDHAERNPHLLEAMRFEQKAQEPRHPLGGHETRPAQAPARYVTEPHGGARATDLVRRDATGVGGGDDRPRAHTGDAMKGNAAALEDTQHARVRDAAGKSSSERQTDSRANHMIGFRDPFWRCSGVTAIRTPGSIDAIQAPWRGSVTIVTITGRGSAELSRHRGRVPTTEDAATFAPDS